MIKLTQQNVELSQNCAMFMNTSTVFTLPPLASAYLYYVYEYAHCLPSTYMYDVYEYEPCPPSTYLYDVCEYEHCLPSTYLYDVCEYEHCSLPLNLLVRCL